MTSVRKYALLGMAALPCLFYARLTYLYFNLIDSSDPWRILSGSIGIALIALGALALSVYVAGRIVRGTTKSTLSFLTLSHIHLRIFVGALLAFLASGFVTSPIVRGKHETETARFWFDPIAEWSSTVFGLLLSLALGYWLGKMAWEFFRDIPKLLSDAPTGHQTDVPQLAE